MRITRSSSARSRRAAARRQAQPLKVQTATKKQKKKKKADSGRRQEVAMPATATAVEDGGVVGDDVDVVNIDYEQHEQQLEGDGCQDLLQLLGDGDGDGDEFDGKKKKEDTQEDTHWLWSFASKLSF